MQLRSLGDSLRPVYVVPRDDIASAVLIPAMSVAVEVRCMAGFFSSSSFAQLAPGLAAFLHGSKGHLYLLISPKIHTADRQAMERANTTPEQVLADAAIRLFCEGALSESALARHTVETLAYLLASGRLQVRFVLMKRGMFHPKVWVFSDTDNMIVAHGSSNPTEPGLLYNFETVSVERSWIETGRAAIFASLFKGVWERRDPTALTIDMPDGLRIAELAAKTSCPTVDDFWRAWQDDADHGLAPPLPANIRVPPVFAPPARLRIPDGLRWEDGPYTHQGRAVNAWQENAGRGILAIATGGGKTIAALVAATRLQSAAPRLFITIAAPFKPLIEQWHREVSRFGVTPVPLADLGAAERTARLEQAIFALKIGHADVEVAIVSHTLLNQPDFRAFLQSIPPEVATLLIADEVHNLGAPGFSSNPPQEFRFRLGLSATPVRQYDEAGTEALLDYFGDVIFEFDLGAAIRTGCLAPYNYYLHPVALDDDELTEWEELTERLRRLGFGAYNEASEELPHDVKLLLFRRRGILENAQNKVATLRSLLLAGDPSSLRHTLIYTSAKHRPGRPTQITQVNRMLNEIGVIAHELTYNETGTGIASDILESFSNGLYQAVTCMKVLDEGVDVPQTTSAYILASSTVRREWVQRRGRILRRAAGKTVAHLHDFLVVPPDPQSPTGRSILRQELERGREFASLAENSAASDGPWEVMARYEPFAT